MRVGRICLLSFALIATSANGPHAQAVQPQALSCHAQQARQVAELLFGFVAHEITPRFPDGFTVTDASGQWRDSADGTIVHEPSERVEIVLPGTADDESRLDAIVSAYKRHSISNRSP
ncbi:MAG: DUF3574 domain-containing protein [Xanthobacteraceae bacterium]